MAVIGKIRQRSGLLILIIGISIVGFLVMDATNQQFGVLKGMQDAVGKVNGQKITSQEFDRKYQENVKNAEDQMQGQPLDESQNNSIRQQTWDEMVNDVIFEKVYKSLGIGVTKEEVREFTLGENLHPYVRQSFGGPNGQVDIAQLTAITQNLDKDQPGEEPGTRKRQWLKFEGAMKKAQYQQKYNNLITKGLYVPAWMAEMAYLDQTRTVDFKYVSLNYSDVNDADIKVTDEELKEYLNNHRAKFKSDVETRKLQYVAFNVVASSTDSAAIVSELEAKRAEFTQGTTLADDSLFVKINSETPFDDVYYEKDQMTSVVTDSFFALNKGTVIGPYVENGSFRLAKITDRKVISDSSRVREIVFSFAQIQPGSPEAVAKYKLMDSIQSLIDSLGADFGLMAAQFSEDPASKVAGGNIGWVKKGQKGKMYNDILFYRAVKGKTYRALEGGDAVHLFQVIEDKPGKTGVLVSYLSREIVPSSETDRAIFSNATLFVSDNQNEAKFREAAKKYNAKTVSNLRDESFDVEGLGAAREIVKWAFKAKKGDISSVFSVNKGRTYVVALLEQIREKGVPDLDAVRDNIKPLVVQEKKFELLSKRIADAKAGSIDDLATKLGKPVLQAERSSFSNPSLNAGSYEQVVVATALGTAAGKQSAPVKGNSGVFVVQTIAVQVPPKQTDYSPFATQPQMQAQSKARYAQQTQKKLADVQDTRSFFF